MATDSSSAPSGVDPGRSRRLRVAWVGTFRPDFSRNQRLKEWLQGSGVDVATVRAVLWPRDRLRAFTEGRLRLLARAIVVYPGLLLRLLLTRRPDVYLVSFPGWLDVPVVRLVAWLKRRPVVFDPFISLYDTAVTDRRLADAKSLVARISLLVDRLALRLADLVIADSEPHSRFYERLAGRRLHSRVLPVGADDSVMKPRPDVEPEPGRVLFYGTYVPLQGAECIVRAAAVLKERQPGARIVMIGEGQDRASAEDLARELGASNMEFRGNVHLEDLALEICRASVVLGIFGTSDKARRVIPHKVYEGMACGRPVITSDTEAIREAFDADEVALVPPGDPDALAAAVEDLLEHPEKAKALGGRAREAYLRRYSHVHQVERLKTLLEDAVKT